MWRIKKKKHSRIIWLGQKPCFQDTNQLRRLVTILNTTACAWKELLTHSHICASMVQLCSVFSWSMFFRKLLTRTSLQKHAKTVNQMMQTMGVLCLHLHILNPLPLMTWVRMMWFTTLQVLFLCVLSKNACNHELLYSALLFDIIRNYMFVITKLGAISHLWNTLSWSKCM